MRIDYRVDRTYGAFLHRELSVNWLALAVRLAGRHQLDLKGGAFTLLEFGCGQGLNLLFNAAAHPQARFFGVDLHPGHVAMAQRRAAELRLTNVSFALADLRDFVAGPPFAGPCRCWPDQYDVVTAHGLASWVAPDTRAALLQAASQQLLPGGIFYCSYNTHPGWLSRSPFQMLALELGLQHSDNTSELSLQEARVALQAFLGTVDRPLPLRSALPHMADQLEAIAAQQLDYLTGEFHAAHEPLYVGAMHRACNSLGLSMVATASLPELFPQMLDQDRRQLLDQAPTPALREVWLDLLINQSFRRDVFAKGLVPPPKAIWRAELEAMLVYLRRDQIESLEDLTCSLGRIAVQPSIAAVLQNRLLPGPVTIGQLADATGQVIEDFLPVLALLLHVDQIGVAACDGIGANAQIVQQFNHQLFERAGLNQGLGGLLIPELLQPLNLSDVQIMLLQSTSLDIADSDRIALVMLSLQMAGLTVNSEAGEPLRDPGAAMARLEEGWQSFVSEGGLAEANRFALTG